MKAIEFQNVFAGYDDNLVLEDINLSLNENEFLGIIGPNGGGKTTFLKVLLGLIEPYSGEVKVFGEKLKKNLHQIGYVPQYSNFDSNYPIKVWDVIMMGRMGRTGLMKKFSGDDKLIAEDALRKVELIEHKDRLVKNLSGGQRQRVLIARALTTNPKILLLDEPTASVDSRTGKNFYELLDKLNENMTIVLVSHDIGAISQSVKKIACLNRKLVFHDSKELTTEMLEQTYHCPIDLIAHGVPHRVLDDSHLEPH